VSHGEAMQQAIRSGVPAPLFPAALWGAKPYHHVRLFRRESRRLANLHKYLAIVTHSSHMREEYIRNGIPESRIRSFVYEIARPGPQDGPEKSVTVAASRKDRSGKHRWNLLFVGRMERLKGGATLLEALPIVVERLGGPIRLTLAG